MACLCTRTCFGAVPKKRVQQTLSLTDETYDNYRRRVSQSAQNPDLVIIIPEDSGVDRYVKSLSLTPNNEILENVWDRAAEFVSPNMLSPRRNGKRMPEHFSPSFSSSFNVAFSNDEIAQSLYNPVSLKVTPKADPLSMEEALARQLYDADNINPSF